MIGKTNLAENKDAVQVIAALIGVIAALLYISGYVAERVHWNLYGHIEVPANHIQFLYRGGNIVISSLASFPLYLLLSPLRATLVLSTILLLVAAVFYDRLPLRTRDAVRIRSSQPFWIGCFVLLLILLLYELTRIPNVPRNILFEMGQVDTSQWGDYFRSYVSVTVLWLAFYIAGYGKQRRQTKSNRKPDAPADSQGQEAGYARIDHKSEGWTFFFVGERLWGTAGDRAVGELKQEALTTKGRAFATGPIQQMLTASLMVAVVLIAFLPTVYGTFQFPNVYPIVDVALAKDPATDLATWVGTSPKALLFETADEYVLYARQVTPNILKLRKSQVSAVRIIKECDITEPETFVADIPCNEH